MYEAFKQLTDLLGSTEAARVAVQTARAQISRIYPFLANQQHKHTDPLYNPSFKERLRWEEVSRNPWLIFSSEYPEVKNWWLVFERYAFQSQAYPE